MRIFSTDQSSTASGWALSEDGQYIDSGVIKKDIKNIDKRIPSMGLAICAKIKELNPTLVTIENIQNQSNINTVIHLARLQGCIILYCASKGIRCEIIGPSQWRSALDFKQGGGVKRDALKQQSIDFVKEYFGFDNRTEDECEALCQNVAAQKIFKD